MSTEQTAQNEQVEETPQETVSSALKQFDNAPTQAQIDQWKVQFGDVFVSGFSETELFIWRAITRPEWVQLQSLAADPERQLTQFQFEEMVCDACVLWKSTTRSWSEGKAGTPSSLQEQILQHSNFMSPQQAAMLVAKL